MRDLRLDYICLTSLLYLYDGNESWLDIIKNNDIGYYEALLILINQLEEFIKKNIDDGFFENNIYELKVEFYKTTLDQSRNIYDNYNI